ITAGLIYVWRRASRMDASRPQVRVLGLYSPILTWLRYPRLSNAKASVTAQPATVPPTLAQFASETIPAPSSASQPTADVPARSDSPTNMGDQLQHGLENLPHALRGWTRKSLNPRALWQSWSDVLLPPAQESAPVGVRVAWRDLALEWLLVG